MEFESETLGETIAFPVPQTSISVSLGGGHALLRMPDGTVAARGSNAYGECMVAGWSNVTAVSAGVNYSLGVRSDGKVVATGQNYMGQCEVDTWENVVQVAAGAYCSYGLTADGRVLACGDNADGHLKEVMEWKDIVAIAVLELNEIVGVDADGTVHYAGSGCERPAITGWQGVKSLCYGYELSKNLMGIKEDGTIVIEELDAMPSWAVENWGEQNPYYKELGEWSGIQQLSCGCSPVLGVQEDGTVKCAAPMGDGPGEWEKILSEWRDMEAMATVSGEPFSYIIGLQKDGTILEYHAENGNATLEEIKEEKLEWIHIAERTDALLAGCEDGKTLRCGGRPIDAKARQQRRNEEIAGMMARLLSDEAVMPFGRLKNDLMNIHIQEYDHFLNVIFNLCQISGQVLSWEDKQPLKGVEIEVVGDDGTTLHVFRTDANGEFDEAFELNNIDPYAQTPLTLEGPDMEKWIRA